MAHDDENVRRREDDEERGYREERPRRRDEDYDDRRRRRDEDDDDDDDRPRRRPRSRREGDATGGFIPYTNPKALVAYYTGVFGLISCFILLGIFGLVPIIFGFLALKYARENPEAGGKVHAIVGIVLGILEVLTFLIQVGFIIVAIMAK
jgi:hypothetical protein